jgi:KDO2-lipid IV(A) lauroyltransferase
MSRAHLALWILRLFALLPLWLAQALGAAVGALMGVIPNSLRRVARVNIDACFPDWSKTERRRLVRRSLMEDGKGVAEMGALWLWPPARVLALMREVRGEELIEQAVAAGRGVIIASPHLGAWEIVGPYLASRWPMTILYRPARLAQLDATIRAARERGGATLVPTDAGGVRALFKALSRGELVGILPDQEPGLESGAFAPFFGVDANTMVLLPRLAQKSGAAVLFVFAERLSWGRGYILRVEPAPEGIADADTAVACAALNKGVERCVRQVPAQYQWSYKRFKKRPQGQAKLY